VTVGYDERGKRKRRTVYGATKTAVIEKVVRLRADALAGTLGDPQHFTVATFLHRWLDRPSDRLFIDGMQKSCGFGSSHGSVGSRCLG